MAWFAIGATVVGGAVKMISSANQRSEGSKLVNQKYPDYQIPSEVTQAANEGLPSEQYAKAMRNIQRQQIAAIGASQDRRSAIGTIGRTQQLTNDATLNLDAVNAQARQKNQQRLAQYKDKQWQLNTKGKYDRDYNYGMNLLGAANTNLTSGIDQITGGIGYAGYKGLFDKKKKDSFNIGRNDAGSGGTGESGSYMGDG